MRKRSLIRLISYSAIILISCSLILFKINIIERGRGREVPSFISEKAKYGMGVAVQKVIRKCVSIPFRITVSPMGGGIIASHVTRDIQQKIDVKQQFYIIENGEHINGEVVFVSDVMDIETGLFKITGMLEKPIIKKTSIITAYVKNSNCRNQVNVLREAVLSIAGKNYVWKVHDDKAFMHEVKPTQELGEYINIGQGVRFGDLIVYRGFQGLSEGGKVRIYSCKDCE